MDIGFWKVVIFVLGYGVGCLIVKRKDNWNEFFVRWINGAVVALSCYFVWFVL